MLARYRTASWLLGAALATGSAFATGSAALAGPKDEFGGKSARDDDAPKAKQIDKGGDHKGSGDLAQRLENLERQVRELTNFVKQRMAEGKQGGDKGVVAGKPGPDKQALAKPDQKKPDGKHEAVDKFAQKGEGKPDAKKPDGKHEAFDKFAKKPEGKPDGKHDAGDKFAKKPEGKPDAEHGKGQLRLVKGPDGQLLVPLSALPPEMQKQIIAHFKEHGQKGEGQKEPGKAGAVAKKPEPKKFDKDDDDDDRPKNPKMADAGFGQKPGKGKDRD